MGTQIAQMLPLSEVRGPRSEVWTVILWPPISDLWPQSSASSASPNSRETWRRDAWRPDVSRFTHHAGRKLGQHRRRSLFASTD